jgi:hypothetical protein
MIQGTAVDTKQKKPTPSVATPPQDAIFDTDNLGMPLDTTLENRRQAAPVIATTPKDATFSTREPSDAIKRHWKTDTDRRDANRRYAPKGRHI